ncbi:MAG: hypothetical protein WCG66_06115 [bacterium]
MPWHDIALVSWAEIHPTIADALAAMPNDPNLIWITGHPKPPMPKASSFQASTAPRPKRV